MQDNDALTCGIILPLTSRAACSPADREAACRRLEGFASNLKATLDAACCKVYLGVDSNDWFSTQEGQAAIHESFAISDGPGLDHEVRVFSDKPGQICSIWRELADHAYRHDNQDFTVLLGDDVRIATPDWLRRAAHHYKHLAAKIFTSKHDQQRFFGFGCVAFTDTSCRNFPSFPILHRLHWQMNGGAILPDAFVNQDADPFLYQTYAHWDAALIALDMELSNEVGGFEKARYEKHHHCNPWRRLLMYTIICAVRCWSDTLRMERRPSVGSTAQNQQYLNSHGSPPISPRAPSLDIIVPTYRAMDKLEHLQGICQLQVANRASTFIIIVDKPDLLERLQQELEQLPRVRVRGNTENLGASAARNRGTRESAADWLLFLDDDVIAYPNIVTEYSNAIAEKGAMALGFVGLTRFLPSAALHTRAVQLSDLTYMFGIAEVLPHPGWGVTANIVLRRTPLMAFFQEKCWAKAGGGEDVDICLRYQQLYKQTPGDWRFHSVPSAQALHPWWSGGKRQFGHFFKWADGDGHLYDHFPQFVYAACPNVAESMVLAVVIATGACASCKCGAAADGMAGECCAPPLTTMTITAPGVLPGAVCALQRVKIQQCPDSDRTQDAQRAAPAGKVGTGPCAPSLLVRCICSTPIIKTLQAKAVLAVHGSWRLHCAQFVDTLQAMIDAASQLLPNSGSPGARCPKH
ncbi:nucleotide-diphospho-sugar transferase [Tribonema minus]|uniref:Nucleotide-diphospho-sugar transferase n=1 Tax=Tribonema minus TaxID=303371 RepID=A0A835YWC2_9STRA|nr:nucleotide-diphospho-sugar transferase [Tribonema minus]